MCQKEEKKKKLRRPTEQKTQDSSRERQDRSDFESELEKPDHLTSPGRVLPRDPTGRGSRPGATAIAGPKPG